MYNKINILIISFLERIIFEIKKHPLSAMIWMVSLTSKGFLGYKNEYGFILAAIASLLISWKVWRDQMKRLAILEFIAIGILIYAFIKWRENPGEIEISEEENIFFMILGVLISLLYIIDVIVSKKTSTSILERISVLCSIIGGVMIFNKIIIGWAIYGMGCFVTAKIQEIKKDLVFKLFQILTGLLCLTVLIKQILR